jgi:hypothetical protein
MLGCWEKIINSARLINDFIMLALSTRLHDVLALLDQIHRGGGCGTQLVVQFGELYECVHALCELHSQKVKSVGEFITEKTPQWFQGCEEFYTHLYLMVYTAMEPTRRGPHQQQPPMKPNGVPIDPQCPLNMIDTTPAPRMTISLHNDNEAVTKYPPSSLYKIDGIYTKVGEVEAYYEEQCSRLHSTYLSHYDEIQKNTTEWNVVDTIRGKVAALLLLCRDGGDTLLPLLSPLSAIDRHVTQLMSHQKTLEDNCTPYRNNVLKWFMVGVQLKDNMLKSYNLTHTHQKTEYINSVF